MIQASPNFLYQEDSRYPSLGLPIHHACSRAMCKKIDLLLAYDPLQALLVEKDTRMLPLHLACRCTYVNFDMETFRQLIEAYPQGAKEKDINGCLPLHYACDAAVVRPDNQDIVSELLKIYPEATQIRDKTNYLPFHYMQQNFAPVKHSFDILKEKQLVALIETYPDALLLSDRKNQLLLGTLAEFQCPVRQVWHAAGRLCTKAFICATQKCLQPLYHLSFDLPALVENLMECPLDWTKNEGEMQDGEFVGIILHYTFEALLEANHGLDSKSNLQSSCNLVIPCLPVDYNHSTVKTTLLHKLAYCSKFCAQHHLKHAVDSYVSRQRAHFFQADNNGNLPLHLVCCAPPPSILMRNYERSLTEKTRASLVKLFLTPCMKSASKSNHLGKTPLDIIMETMSELSEFNIESWGCVELLVKASPTEANKLFTKEKMYLFMLAAIGKQANLSLTFSTLLSFVEVCNLDGLRSTKIV